jgi:hypothetical protein
MAARLAFAGGAGAVWPERCRRWLSQAWRRLGWRQVALAALIGFLAAALGPNGGAFLFPGHRSSDPFADLLAGRWVFGILPLVFAAMVADEAHREGISAFVAYGSALVLGSFAASALDMAGGHVVGWTRSSTWTLNGFRLKQLLLQGGLCMAIYAYWRSTQRALLRVQAAEADRLRDRQQLLAARLMALQARVEPQFLFDALSRIGELHERDPQGADALLADLIALLRAMLPVGSAATSSVEREFALATAWLRVQRHLGAPFEVEIAASPLAARSALGPMLVVPLLQEMLALPGARGRVWLLSAEAVASGQEMPRMPRLSLRLAPRGAATGRGDGATATPTIDRLRERLAELHGDAATLTVTVGDDGTASFALDLPLAQDSHADAYRPDR